jgi:hypothetical protein
MRALRFLARLSDWQQRSAIDPDRRIAGGVVDGHVVARWHGPH